MKPHYSIEGFPHLLCVVTEQLLLMSWDVFKVVVSMSVIIPDLKKKKSWVHIRTKIEV